MKNQPRHEPEETAESVQCPRYSPKNEWHGSELREYYRDDWAAPVMVLERT